MKKSTCFVISIIFAITTVSAKEYFVSAKVTSSGNGSKEAPFKTISEAAKIAVAGDIITVGEGIYREWIDPANGGENDAKRIVYRAAPGEKVEIKGSEVVQGWVKQSNGTWMVYLPDSFFKGNNSCKTELYGDWLWKENPKVNRVHTADLYINGNSMFEADSMCHVVAAKRSEKAVDTVAATYRWFSVNDDKGTTIYANFKDINPNKALVELSVRPTCFYPTKQGINYITISGFDISQAASQWGAPTAHQVGMVATHWNKGWIIENNRLHDTKSSAITLGKDESTGHNVWSAKPEKSGNAHYIETTLKAIEHGWNKENIGSHIVRNNTIFNCEQTGICGSMGCAFSEIYNNHIYNIWVKRQYAGAEIGGIKFHAAIDTYIHNNYIHDCMRGLWLDWMTQGTRVSSNLMHSNVSEDIFMEVNHGPYIIDNNILLSNKALSNQSQGGAYIHNLLAGDIEAWPERERMTPYHYGRSTRIKGVDVPSGGDDRFFNNVFLSMGPNSKWHGMTVYNNAKFPVNPKVAGSIYCNDAIPYKGDTKYIGFNEKPYSAKLEHQIDGSVYLILDMPSVDAFKNDIITSDVLGVTIISEEAFTSPEDKVIVFDTDYLGVKRNSATISGPFESLDGKTRIKVWPK